MTLPLPELVAGVLLVALVLYALLAGADFGGGVWDLLARGKRAAAQRRAVERALGPIWEANHVWMIAVVVILFTAFPNVFALAVTLLHVPLTLMLVGIVLRGTSFVFRTYDVPAGRSPWGRVFAISSIFTPLMLGIVIGAVSSPATGWAEGRPNGGFLGAWLRPFPLTVGLFALVLFAFLAAAYLTVEVAEEGPLADDFRARALASAAVLALLAAAAWLLAGEAAPDVRHGLAGTRWGEVLGGGGVAALGGAGWALVARHWVLARALAGTTAALVVGGWGAAMYPHLLAGGPTIREAAAPEATLRLLAIAAAVGVVVLVPSLVHLYRVFKGAVVLAPEEPPPPPEPRPEP